MHQPSNVPIGRDNAGHIGGGGHRSHLDFALGFTQQILFEPSQIDLIAVESGNQAQFSQAFQPHGLIAVVFPMGDIDQGPLGKVIEYQLPMRFVTPPTQQAHQLSQRSSHPGPDIEQDIVRIGSNMRLYALMSLGQITRHLPPGVTVFGVSIGHDLAGQLADALLNGAIQAAAGGPVGVEPIWILPILNNVGLNALPIGPVGFSLSVR